MANTTRQSFDIVANIKGNIEPIKNSIESLQKLLNNGNLDLSKSTNKDFVNIFSKLSGEIKNYQALLSSKNNLGDFSEADAKKITKSSERIHQMIRLLGVDINDLSKNAENLIPDDMQKELKSLTTQWEQLKRAQDSGKLNKDIDAQTKKLDEQREAASKLVNKINELTTKRNSYLKYQKEAQNKADSTQNELTDVNKRLSELEEIRNNNRTTSEKAEFKNLKDQRAQLQASIKQLRSQAGSYEKEINDTQSEIDKLRVSLKNANTEIDITEKNLNDLKQSKNAPEGLTKLREEISRIANIKLDDVPTDMDELKNIIGGLRDDQIKQVNAALKQIINTSEGLGHQANENANNINDFNSALERSKEVAEELDNMTERATNFFSIGGTIRTFTRAIREAFNTVKELDTTMTEAAVVTDFSISDMWDQLPTYAENAQKLGVAINDLYKANTLYYQQGLNTNQSMELGIETLKMARVGNIEAGKATEYMTSALRSFNMELNETSAQRINDVYSELAAITAADTGQIAVAMSKTASIAASANMEFETTAAFLSQIIETTQEAPETAGTAVKTIIARFSEVKDLYNKGIFTGADEEGEVIEVNRIAKALNSVGISMNKFFAGEQGLDEILLELASRWDSLDFSTQRYIATQAAGSRQQSRFIAMMSNYQRTMELVNAANNSAGASNEQYNKTLESLDAKLAQLKAAWQEFTMGIANSDIIKTIVTILTGALKVVNRIIDSLSNGSSILKTIISILLVIKAFKFANVFLKGFKTILDKVKELKEDTKKQGEEGGQGFGDKFINAVLEVLDRRKAELIEKARQTGQEMSQAAEEGVQQNATQIDTQDNQPTQQTQNQPLPTEPSIEDLEKQYKDLDEKYQEALDLAFGNGNNDIKIGRQYLKTHKSERQNFKKKFGKNYSAKNVGKEIREQAKNDAKKYEEERNKIGEQIKNKRKTPVEVPEIPDNSDKIKDQVSWFDKLEKSSIKVAKGLALAGAACVFLGNVIPQTTKVSRGFSDVFSSVGTGLSVASQLMSINPKLAVIAGIGTTIVSLIAKWGDFRSEEQKVQDSINTASEVIEYNKQKVQDLNGALDLIRNQDDVFDGLTRGSLEWQEALLKNNEQIQDLIDKYPELTGKVKIGDGGVLSIDEQDIVNAQEKAIKAQIEATNVTNLGRIRLAQEGLQDFYSHKLIDNSGQDIAPVDNEDILEKVYGTSGEHIIEAQKAYREGNLKPFLEKQGLSDTEINKYIEAISLNISLLDENLAGLSEGLTELNSATNLALNGIINSSEDFTDEEKEIASKFVNTEDYFSARQEVEAEFNKENKKEQSAKFDSYLKRMGYTKNSNGNWEGQDGVEIDSEKEKDLKETFFDSLAIEKIIEQYKNGVDEILNGGGIEELNNFFLNGNALDIDDINRLKDEVAKLEDGDVKDFYESVLAEFEEQVGYLKGNEITGEFSKVGAESLTQFLQSAVSAFGEGAIKQFKDSGWLELVNELSTEEESAFYGILDGINSSTTITDLKNQFKDLGLFAGKSDEEVNDLCNILIQLGSTTKLTEEQVRDSINKLYTLYGKINSDNRTYSKEDYDTFKEGLGTAFDDNDWVQIDEDNFVYLGDSNDKLREAIENNTEAWYNKTAEQKKQDIQQQVRFEQIDRNGIESDIKNIRNQDDAEALQGKVVAAGIEYGYYDGQKIDLETLDVTTDEGIKILKTILTDFLNQSSEEMSEELSEFMKDQELAEIINKANAQGIDANELLDELHAIQKVYDLSTKEALRLASANLKIQKGIEELGKDYKDLKKILKESNKGTVEYEKALTDVKDRLAEAFDIDSSQISDNFLEGLIDSGELDKILEGDRQAIFDFQKQFITAEKAGVESLELSKNAINELSEQGYDGISTLIDLINAFPDINAKGEIDVSNILNNLDLTEQELNALIKAMESVGFEPVYDEVEILKAYQNQYKSAGYENDPFFGYNYQAYKQEVKGKYLKTFKSARSYSGSSSSGGGGGSDSKSWKNPYTKQYNAEQKLDELIRQRSNLEAEFNRISARSITTQDQLASILSQQLFNLESQSDIQQQLIKGRKELLAQAKNQTASVEEGKAISYQQAYEKAGGSGDISQYGSYDLETGVITINWEKINALQSKDAEQGQAVEDYISYLEDISSQIEEAQDNLKEIEDSIVEILDQQLENRINYITSMSELLKEQQQRQIDVLSKVNDEISSTNEDILKGIQEQIDLERQIRDNTKTEQEISDKEARLAYLRRDTSGANAVEIKQLEKELSEARESYGDTLVDQELDRLSEQNDKAQEQREKQIELLEAQLEFYTNTGYYEQIAKGLDESSAMTLWQEMKDYQYKTEEEKISLMKEFRELFNKGANIPDAILAAEDSLYKDTYYQATNGNGSTQKVHYGRDANGNIGWIDDSGALVATDGDVIGADVNKNTIQVSKNLNEQTVTPTTDEPSAPTPQSSGDSSETYPYGKASETSGNIKKGGSYSKSDAKAIQYALNKLGYGNSGTESLDGVIGDKTVEAIKKFQKDSGLNADGIVGNDTRNAFALKKYRSGGLANFTGPAWLDGTKSRPEIVLNQSDSQNFIELRDILSGLFGSRNFATEKGGDNYYEFHINVDEIANDYDVDRLVERVKEEINSDARYRNVNAINLLR